jgi:hypothetical protein
VLGQDDERDYGQPYQRADNERKGKENLLFTL